MNKRVKISTTKYQNSVRVCAIGFAGGHPQDEDAEKISTFVHHRRTQVHKSPQGNFKMFYSEEFGNFQHQGQCDALSLSKCGSPKSRRDSFGTFLLKKSTEKEKRIGMILCSNLFMPYESLYKML